MRIGLDFDNTIVSYDALFHRVAREQDVVPANTPVNKIAVRDHLRNAIPDGIGGGVASAWNYIWIDR